MKSKILIILLSSVFYSVQAQTFLEKNRTSAADNLKEGEFIDFDKDGFQEYFYIQSDSLKAYDIIDSTFATYDIKLPKSAEFTWADITKDNFPDIAFSGVDAIGYYLNDSSNINLMYNPIDSIEVNRLNSIDLDLNGEVELLGIVDGQFTIYKKDTIKWKELNLFPNLEVLNYQIIDFNNDGLFDIATQTLLGQQIIINTGRHQYHHGDTLLNINKLAAFDFNSDGDNDFLMWDKAAQNLELHLSGLNPEKINLDSLGFSTITAMNMVDLNSNGKPDIAIAGEHAGKYLLKIALNDSLEEYAIERYEFSDEIESINFGDVDNEGDLDLALHNKKNIIFYLNSTVQQNGPPMMVPGTTAFPTLNGVYIFFDSAYDDSTPSAALTYDLMCKSEQGIIVASFFNVSTYRRLVNGEGNIGRSLKAYLPDVEPGFYEYQIQAIDNAFYAGSSAGSSGICYGGFEVCDKYEMHKINVCAGEEIKLQGDSTTIGRWFSANKKDLVGDFQSSYSFKPTVSDTIYYASTYAQKCSDYQIWIIDLLQAPEQFLEDKTVCENQELILDLEDWSVLEWQSSLLGLLDSTKTFNYISSKNDELVFELVNDSTGCILKDTISVNVSNDFLEADPDYSIKNNSGVQLIAAGAIYYQWFPPNGLSDANIANPFANPKVTTQYTVVGTDSIGCTDSTMVYVEVINYGYIPNLFTPNGDGKNDIFKPLELYNTESLKFTIYNRSGVEVFTAHTIDMLIQKGWDGSYKGRQQPEGVYYWKIKGNYLGGDPILLNGKDSGEIVLMR